MAKTCAKPDPRGFVNAHTRPHLSEPASQKDRQAVNVFTTVSIFSVLFYLVLSIFFYHYHLLFTSIFLTTQLRDALPFSFSLFFFFTMTKKAFDLEFKGKVAI